jgi:hypothetical protein
MYSLPSCRRSTLNESGLHDRKNELRKMQQLAITEFFRLLRASGACPLFRLFRIM